MKVSILKYVTILKKELPVSLFHKTNKVRILAYFVFLINIQHVLTSTI